MYHRLAGPRAGEGASGYVVSVSVRIRTPATIAMAVVVVGLSWAPPARPQSSPSDLIAAACAMPAEYIERVVRGSDPRRSGDVVFVTREPNFIGNLSHSGPWEYLQRVPMFWYGPGHVPAVGRVSADVTAADIAPTFGRFLDFPFEADGSPMEEAVGDAGKPPALIVTVVWDGGGMNVLEAWPRSWPVLRRLIPEGVWYERATVGSSPSVTPSVHATIGTGVFPERHGQIDIEMRIGADVIRSGEEGLGLLVEPTFADLYDLATGDRALVGAVVAVTWHIYMASHGAMWGGSDRDIAVMRSPTGATSDEAWHIPAGLQPFFELPRYVNDLPPLERYVRDLDRADGAIDGRWLGNDFASLRDGLDTPARIPLQTNAIAEVIEREGFGDDDVPDLLFVNHKVIDHIGHLYSTNSPEMRSTLEAQDADLETLIAILDREVGRGRWVLLLTADHGHQLDPEVSGAFRMTHGQLTSAIEDRFDDGDDVGIVEAVNATQVFLDHDELRDTGTTAEDVARFLLSLTESDGARYGATVTGDGTEPVFSTALPRELLWQLPCGPSG